MNPVKQIYQQLKKVFCFFKTQSHCGDSLGEFQKKINYQFNRPELLVQSLTHKSFVNPDDKKGLLSNERMEFLGDSVLNFLVTEHLFNLYPEYSEGELSKIKSLLVSRKILGEVARSIDLGNFIIIGKSEKKSGGYQRMSIISNAFEAIIGAVYLDGGVGEVRKILSFCLFDNMNQYVKAECNINFKSKILEMAQGDGLGTPCYPLLASEGPDHAKKFTVGIEIAGVRLGIGKGNCKKDAQQNAAHKAITNYDKELILSRLREV